MAQQTISLDEFMADYLSDPEDLAEYINNAIEEGTLMPALGRVAKVYGMGKLAERTDLNRENLYKMLSEDGNPCLSNLEAILDTIGLKLQVTAKRPAA